MTSPAYKFYKTFYPKPGLDYSWLLSAAKAKYDQVDKAVEYVDAKAAAIINYFGSGVGVLTFAAAGGAGTGAVSAQVVASAIPAFLAGVGSVIVAAVVRNPVGMEAMPSAGFGVELVEQFERWNAGKTDIQPAHAVAQAEYATAGLWQIASEKNTVTLSRKADLLSWAVWLKAGAIALLLVPLIAATAEKWNKPAVPPTHEYITPAK